MTDLPPGWEWTTLGEIADSVKNGIFISRPGVEPNGVPILRISAVRPLTLDTGDLRYTAMSEEEIAAQGALLNPGDLLFTRYSGTPEYVGVCTTVPTGLGPLTYPDKLIRVQLPQHVVDPRFVALAFASPSVRDQVKTVLRTTAGQVGISGGALKEVPFPLPPLPEQRRIVSALEDHLSRIDAGADSLKADSSRLKLLVKRLLVSAVPLEEAPAHWKMVTVAEAGTVDLGRQRHPDWHEGPNMRPYLRVANVFEDRIDLDDVMEMDFPSDVFERFRLRKHDILLNEGQSPEYLGRPAMYRGHPPEMAFTNSLLRFRASPEVEPEWALLVFRRHMHARRFIKEVRITTNIAHLSATRFKSVEFPIPPLDEQRAIVDYVSEQLAALARLQSAIESAQAKARTLRSSLLNDAFTGQLVPQDPDDETASLLLERISAERAAQPKAKRTRKTKPAQETLL